MIAQRVLRQRCLACHPLSQRIAPVLSRPRLTASPSRVFHSTPGRKLRFLNQLTPQEAEEQVRNARPLVSHQSATRFTNAGTSRSSRAFVIGCMAAAFVFFFANSQKVPVTGRRRFNFLSDPVVEWWAGDAEDILQEMREHNVRILSPHDWRYRRVEKVMSRLVPVSGLADVDWKIHVIHDDETVNAFVIPGGHIFVFSGLLNLAQSSDQLATVLSHEISHNVAAHASERLSASAVASLTAGSLFFLWGALPGVTLFTLWGFTGGRFLADFLYSLPMSRTQETEADYIGLMMMAEACYDPRQAIKYWERMDLLARQGGVEVPELLSTHPSNDHRIHKMNQWLPEAIAKSEASDCSGGTGALADEFRQILQGRQLIRLGEGRDMNW